MSNISVSYLYSLYKTRFITHRIHSYILYSHKGLSASNCLEIYIRHGTIYPTYQVTKLARLISSYHTLLDIINHYIIYGDPCKMAVYHFLKEDLKMPLDMRLYYSNYIRYKHAQNIIFHQV